MRFTNKFFAVSAMCLLTSLAAFSQEVIQPSDKTVATVSDVKTTPESTEAIKPKVEETMATPVKPEVKEITTTPVKRQSADSDSWKGFYLGGYGGATVDNTKLATIISVGVASPGLAQNINETQPQTVKPRGFTGGGQFGYNHQAGNFVIGAEVDFGSFRENKSTELTIPNGSNTDTLTQSIKTDWLLTVRPRAGVAAGKALIYGTGGLALTNLNYQMAFITSSLFFPTVTNAAITLNEKKAGWVAGGGAEFKVAEKWSVKGEYLYTNFKADGQTSYSRTFIINPPTPTTQTSTLNSSANIKSNSFRFAVNYHF